ncbi:DUF397 domain-containing protein [Crossiella sp. NPDC003009]
MTTTLIWFRSSYSGPGGPNKTDDCVEVAFTPKGIFVRDSKTPHGGELRFPLQAWIAFTERLASSAERATWPLDIYSPSERGDKFADRGALDFGRAQWRGADMDGERVEFAFLPLGDLTYVGMRQRDSLPVLVFDAPEWAAFVLGVLNGEFTPALAPA